LSDDEAGSDTLQRCPYATRPDNRHKFIAAERRIDRNISPAAVFLTSGEVRRKRARRWSLQFAIAHIARSRSGTLWRGQPSKGLGNLLAIPRGSLGSRSARNSNPKGSATGLLHAGTIKMKRIGKNWMGAGFLCMSLAFAGAAYARTQTNDLRSGYEPARETTLLGTISSFVADSDTGPLGAHVKLQTAAGIVDVHVGSAEFLKINKLSLNSGDSVRIIGESFSNGANAVFLARIIQKGTLAVAVRSPKGMPLWPAGSRIANEKNRGGAL
jgi:hypothetical protein